MSRKSKEAAREERRKKVAANLRGGLTYRQMAEALGVSIGTIANDVKITLGRLQREQVQDIEQWVLLELSRLDTALNAIWDEVVAGDNQAIGTLLKLMERRAKLLGLDAPVKQRTQNLNVDMGQLTDDQLQRIANGEDPIRVIASDTGSSAT